MGVCMALVLNRGANIHAQMEYTLAHTYTHTRAHTRTHTRTHAHTHTHTGMLDQLLADGIKYMFVSNSDNLGATLDLELLNYFAESDKSFIMEV